MAYTEAQERSAQRRLREIYNRKSRSERIKLAEKLGYRFVAVTSLSNDESAQKLRTCNLKKLFGNDTFVEYHYLGCGDDKDEILLDMSCKDIMALILETRLLQTLSLLRRSKKKSKNPAGNLISVSSLDISIAKMSTVLRQKSPGLT